MEAQTAGCWSCSPKRCRAAFAEHMRTWGVPHVAWGWGLAVSHLRMLPSLQAVSQHPSTVAVCCGPFIEAWRNYTGGMFDIAGACAPPCHAARQGLDTRACSAGLVLLPIMAKRTRSDALLGPVAAYHACVTACAFRVPSLRHAPPPVDAMIYVVECYNGRTEICTAHMPSRS